MGGDWHNLVYWGFLWLAAGTLVAGIWRSFSSKAPIRIWMLRIILWPLLATAMIIGAVAVGADAIWNVLEIEL